IKAGGYFLIQAAAGTGGTVDLPTPDATCNISMSALNFKLRLLDNNGNVVDFLGVGTANEYETKAASTTSNSTSAQRKDNDGSEAGITNGWDTDNNSEDFYIAAPTPRNSQYQGNDGGEDPGTPVIVLPIAEA
ncbi:nuclease, partial [Vibrio parahaemolyticus]|nr:nuclease [Vibrio parahaemolyticus]